MCIPLFVTLAERVFSCFLFRQFCVQMTLLKSLVARVSAHQHVRMEARFTFLKQAEIMTSPICGGGANDLGRFFIHHNLGSQRVALFLSRITGFLFFRPFHRRFRRINQHNLIAHLVFRESFSARKCKIQMINEHILHPPGRFVRTTLNFEQKYLKKLDSKEV